MKTAVHRNFVFAFDPCNHTEKDEYHRKIRLTSVIHDLLNECCINIKSRGYTYIRDAVCLITDHDTYDICLNNDIYPHIARKYNIKGISRIEHNIRNSIDAAYHSGRWREGNKQNLMHIFDSKPTPKQFLLHMTHEADRRLWNELSCS